jgi:uncharacterized membrane protein YhaH (DUF805 family)
MLNTIIRGFANLTRFSGRDTRAQFWPYAAAAVALYFAVGCVAITPILMPVFAASQLSAATFEHTVGHFLLASLLLFGALVVLLAAAVARRLHDGSRSVIWGVLPLPFAVFSGTMFFPVVSAIGAGAAPGMGLFLSVFASNMLYLLGVGRLIFLLARRGTPAPNRYG